MRKTTGVFILMAVSLGLAEDVRAATIFGSLTAQVRSLDESIVSVPSGIVIGSTLSVEFSYNTEALTDRNRSGTFGDPDAREYGSGLNLSITITGEGHTWSGTSSDGYALIKNGGVGGVSDRFEIEVRLSYGGTFDSFPGSIGGGDSYIAFALSDNSAPLNLTNSLLLPTRTSDLNLAGAHNNAVAIVSHGGGYMGITAEPDLNSLTIVPEPVVPLLLVLSMAMHVLSRRRTRKLTSLQIGLNP